MYILSARRFQRAVTGLWAMRSWDLTDLAWGCTSPRALYRGPSLGEASRTHQRWPLGDEGKQAKSHRGGVRSTPLPPRLIHHAWPTATTPAEICALVALAVKLSSSLCSRFDRRTTSILVAATMEVLDVGLIRKRKVLLICSSLLNSLLFSGIIFGWAPLQVKPAWVSPAQRLHLQKNPAPLAVKAPCESGLRGMPFSLAPAAGHARRRGSVQRSL